MERMERATPTQNHAQGRDMATEGWSKSDVLTFARRMQFPPVATQELIAGYSSAAKR